MSKISAEDDWGIDELRNYFNTAYGLESEWPRVFLVSARLYGIVCQTIFDHHVKARTERGEWTGLENRIYVSLGSTGGIMFKDVELKIKDAN